MMDMAPVVFHFDNFHYIVIKIYKVVIWTSQDVCLYVLSFMLWCLLQFLHKNDVRFVFISSCFIYVISVCLHIVVSNTYHVVFLSWFVFLCLVYPMTPVSLDCPLPLQYSLMFIISVLHSITLLSLLFLL